MDDMLSAVSANLDSELLAGSLRTDLRRVVPCRQLRPPRPPAARATVRAVDRSVSAAAEVDSGAEADDELEPDADFDVEGDEEQTLEHESGRGNASVRVLLISKPKASTPDESRPGHVVNASARKEAGGCGMRFTVATTRRRYSRSIWTATAPRGHQRATIHKCSPGARPSLSYAHMTQQHGRAPG